MSRLHPRPPTQTCLFQLLLSGQQADADDVARGTFDELDRKGVPLRPLWVARFEPLIPDFFVTCVSQQSYPSLVLGWGAGTFAPCQQFTMFLCFVA